MLVRSYIISKIWGREERFIPMERKEQHVTEEAGPAHTLPLSVPVCHELQNITYHSELELLNTFDERCVVSCAVPFHADLAELEGASLFIPVSSPIASTYDALVTQQLPKGCR